MLDSLAVAALPYQDPPIKTILILLSFHLLLNALNHILDHTIYCGLVGQVLIGVAFGTPCAKWLDEGTEQVIMQLGYLGLICLVYEGGLNTDFRSLKANACLSTLVALTGICLPIAFAFCLQSLASATGLQAFAAGAALCSTSLGTTLSVLSSSGLTDTRLGTVLTSAAMMDDVFGLVLVQVVSKLGLSSSSLHAMTVMRPILASIGLVLLIFLTCGFIVKPFSSLVHRFGSSAVVRAIQKQPDEATLITHAALLFGLVAAASYAGTSNLFAAYLAGASIRWYYSEVDLVGDVGTNQRTGVTQSTASRFVQRAGHSEENVSRAGSRNSLDVRAGRSAQLGISDAATTQESDERMREMKRVRNSLRGVTIYKKYIEQPVARILKPFFFASIGFSIPVTRMFTSALVWRGVVFAILMLIGKLITGIWLVRISGHFATTVTRIKTILNCSNSIRRSCINLAGSAKRLKPKARKTAGTSESKAMPEADDALATDGGQSPLPSSDRHSQSAAVQSPSSPVSSLPQAATSPTPSRSMYPAAIVGTAMVARGEIGFLIAALAESTGIFNPHDESVIREDHGSDIYLVIIWAISLCTVIGPAALGFLVRRVKKLQRQRREEGGGTDPLGVWGVL